MCEGIRRRPDLRPLLIEDLAFVAMVLLMISSK